MYYKQELLQEFVAKDDNLYKIKFYLNGINNTSFTEQYLEPYFIISLEDEKNNVVEEHKYGKVFLNNDGSFDFQFNKLKNSKGKKYYVRIKNYHKNGLLNIILEKNNTEDDAKVIMNGKELESHMLIASVYKAKKNDVTFFVWHLL